MNMHNPARERSVQELMFHWPTVIRRAGDDWTRGFTLSIAALAGSRPGWQPTPKQRGVMQRLVADLFAPVHMGPGSDDAKVLE